MNVLKYANIAVKVLLVGLLIHLLLFPDLPQYLNKGMSNRLVFYPIGAFGGYIIYTVLRRVRHKKFTYPHLIDLLLTICITTDMLGNTLNFYDSIDWWDDMMHFANSILWVLIVGILLRRYTALKKFNIAALTLSFGAVSHILWELAEYVTFVPYNAFEESSAYRDTMGDLALSLAGSLMGAVLIATVFWHSAAAKKSNRK